MATYEIQKHGIFEASGAVEAMREVMRRARYIDPQPGVNFAKHEFRVFRLDDSNLSVATDSDERGAILMQQARLAMQKVAVPAGIEIDYLWSDIHGRVVVSAFDGTTSMAIQSHDQVGLHEALSGMRINAKNSWGGDYWAEKG
jgi:hypothetical protein